uniref:hypothetical protein n=1 Tax=Thiocapsa sp. TaxID=2024551 RepID=UPI0035945CC1
MILSPSTDRPSLAAPFAPGSRRDAVRRADTLADLTRIFVPETQICIHSPPGSPNLLGALAGVRASGGSGL